MSKLLEQAKTIQLDMEKAHNRKSAPLDIDLAIAWAKGDIRTMQVLRTIAPSKTKNRGSVYNWLATSLREAVRHHRLFPLISPGKPEITSLMEAEAVLAKSPGIRLTYAHRLMQTHLRLAEEAFTEGQQKK